MVLMLLLVGISDVLAVQHIGQHLLLLRCYINKLDLDLEKHTTFQQAEKTKVLLSYQRSPNELVSEQHRF